jgi:hypothetical protein
MTAGAQFMLFHKITVTGILACMIQSAIKSASLSTTHRNSSLPGQEVTGMKTQIAFGWILQKATAVTEDVISRLTFQST